ncbi:MAG: 50S ribosomal protein L29 [Chlamydiales bacterium]|nr:50S ribosomal protein L29 [Chlamydiales bacterium]MDP1608807.1 50S ribosomal protein L29 [Chlamydiales bacterium]
MAKQEKISNLSLDELKTKATELDREIFELRNQLAFHRRLEKPHLMKAKKKERARILTVLTQKQAVVA